MDVGGVLGKGKAGGVLGQRRCQRCLAVILRHGGKLPCLDFCQRVHQRLGAYGADAVKQFAAGFLGVDGDRLDHQHIAGVKPLVQLHNGNAGFGIAVQHCPLDGCRAAVLGQQRNVQVDAAVLGNMQQLRRDNAAIRHHHNNIGCQLLNQRIGRTVAQRAGLVDRNVVALRQLLDRGRGQDLLAPHGLVAAGKHGAHLMPGAQQGCQAVGGNIGCAHKKDAHRISPRFLRGSRPHRNALPDP